MNTRYLYSIEEIKTRLNGCALGLAQKLAPGGVVHGAEYVARNPSRPDRKAGSFSVNLRKGVWKDFATDQGGDLLALIAEFACCGDYSRAVKWALDFLGLTNKTPDPAETKRLEEQARAAKQQDAEAAAARRRAAFAIYLEAKPLDGTDPASLYLKGRGIDVAKLPGGIPRALRFHPKCVFYDGWRPDKGVPPPTLPAMIGCFSREGLPNGFAAVHRTYLEPVPNGNGWQKKVFAIVDGKRPAAKRALGEYMGASIRLVAGESGKPLMKAPAGEWIALAEGIENALTASLARPELRVLALGSGPNFLHVALPEQIGGVYMIADNESNADAQAAFEKYRDALNERFPVAVVQFPKEFKDANDALLGRRKEMA